MNTALDKVTQQTIDNAMSIAQLNTVLREPIKKTFQKQSFTIYADVERVNSWQSHLYVTLVDKSSNHPINLTVFIRDIVLAACPYPIEAHMKLLITGTITLGTKNEITLTATSFENLGIGQMQRQIDKWKVAYQYIFQTAKKPLPVFCKNIALISNPLIQGFTDFTAHLRYGSLTVFPTNMQGKNVAEDIAMQINSINILSDYDCICIVRGGGNFANLFEFNKPVLLEAIAASAITVISAVGHETDHPLCDAAADIRCSTPTDGAKTLTNHMAYLISDIIQNKKEMENRYNRIKALNQVATDNELAQKRLNADNELAQKRLKKQHLKQIIWSAVIIVILLLFIITKFIK